MNKKLIGLPCVGGKSRLADVLSAIIEEQADKGNVTEVYDLCGGGGKIILSLDHKKFKRLGYNEYEYGVATLMAMLKERDNVSIINNKVQFILDKVLTLGSAADKESIYRALFQVAKKHVVCGYDNHKEVDPMTVAALTTIVIYGSVHSNRNTILYNAKDTKGKVFCRFEKRLGGLCKVTELFLESFNKDYFCDLDYFCIDTYKYVVVIDDDAIAFYENNKIVGCISIYFINIPA